MLAPPPVPRRPGSRPPLAARLCCATGSVGRRFASPPRPPVVPGGHGSAVEPVDSRTRPAQVLASYASRRFVENEGPIELGAASTLGAAADPKHGSKPCLAPSHATSSSSLPSSSTLHRPSRRFLFCFCCHNSSPRLLSATMMPLGLHGEKKSQKTKPTAVLLVRASHTVRHWLLACR